MAPMPALHHPNRLIPHLLATAALLWCCSAQAQSPVYRCGSSYSQTPCAGGHAIDDKLSTLHHSTAAAPGQATVYLCQGQGGGQFWASSHCGQHSATIERMETVSASLPWPQQVQQAQSQWEQARGLPRGQHSRTSSPRASAARIRASEAKAEKQAAQQSQQQTARCSALRARLTQLDAQGHAGSQHTDLERLRAERRQTRSILRDSGC